MSKLYIAVLAFSTASLAVGHQEFSLDVFLNNPKIKLLSNPGVKGAYPGDDTNYDDLLKALAAVHEPVTIGRVKGVLKEHAPKLFQRVEAAEAAFTNAIDSIKSEPLKNFILKIGQFIEKYYLVGLNVNEQAKQILGFHEIYDPFVDEYKKMVDEKLKEAAKAVEKALYNRVAVPCRSSSSSSSSSRLCLSPYAIRDSLGSFLNNPKIKLLSKPGVKGAYPGDDTNYDILLKVLDVLKEHAPSLFKRVWAAKDAFGKVLDSIDKDKPKTRQKHPLSSARPSRTTTSLAVGNDQAEEVVQLQRLYDGLYDDAKMVVDEKLHEAAEYVEKPSTSLYPASGS